MVTTKDWFLNDNPNTFNIFTHNYAEYNYVYAYGGADVVTDEGSTSTAWSVDTFYGGTGNDTLSAFRGPGDQLFGEGGNDELHIRANAYREADNSLISGWATADGGSGYDTLHIDNGDDGHTTENYNGYRIFNIDIDNGSDTFTLKVMDNVDHVVWDS